MIHTTVPNMINNISFRRLCIFPFIFENRDLSLSLIAGDIARAIIIWHSYLKVFRLLYYHTIIIILQSALLKRAPCT